MVRVLKASRLFFLLIALSLCASSSFGATKRSSSTKKKSTKVARSTKSTVKRTSATRSTVKKATSKKRRISKASAVRRRSTRRSIAAGGPWKTPTYADSTLGDNVEGEDLVVRRAAVEALGPYNGSVVVADPETGRILTIVNQKLAFDDGFQPCSTVKIYAALAGLTEGIIDRDTDVRLYGRTRMNLTDALARSNNPYFANIGVKLGYDKIAYYGRLLGLGEKATLNVAEEQPGTIPDGPPRNGGMGMMTSFGEGIKLTPLQLTATLVAVANGGTLYYLQYPRSDAEAKRLVPRVKRELDFDTAIPELMPGMLGATEYGTARRAHYDPSEPIFGKTGTCTDRATPTHLGWFGSFNTVGDRKLVVVVLLTGGRPVNGPVASGVAGQIYRTLSRERFFADTATPTPPVALFSGSAW